MPFTLWKIATGALFVLTFALGYLLSRSGKPYNPVVFTVHKLAALAALVVLARQAYLVQRAAPLNPLQWTALLLAAACFIAAIATGGLLSVERPAPAIVGRLHQVVPYLTLLASAASIYLLPAG